MKNNDIIKRDYDDGEDFFAPIFDGFFNFTPFKKEFKHMDMSMKTDIQENENSYEFDIEMPGFQKEDITLDLNDGYLVVKGEKAENKDEKDKKGNYIRRERKFGSCSRSYFVGHNVKEEDVQAKLEHGVLKICVPKDKPQIENKKKIEIQ